jgi:hypothetical protein
MSNVDLKEHYIDVRIERIKRRIKPSDVPLDETSIDRLKLFMKVLGCEAPIIQKKEKSANIIAEWRSTAHYMQMEFDAIQPIMKLDVRPPSQGVTFDLKKILEKEGFPVPTALLSEEEKQVADKG